MVKLRVNPEWALELLQRTKHNTFQNSLEEHWVVDGDVVKPQSVLWLYCWAKTGMSSIDVASFVHKIFNEILDVSFETFDAKVPHEWAQDMRYAPGDISHDLERLLAEHHLLELSGLPGTDFKIAGGLMTIGDIDGAEVGSIFESRRALHDAGVHRPLQAGIAGTAAEGAESIVLSGGYVDDEDHGNVIIYTGHGGRDPGSGRQIADQEFTRQNQALVTSCLQGSPVRVVRGSGHRSVHSPASGFRYDGLYAVDSYWKERGADGFLVCRYRLVADRSPPTALSDRSTGVTAEQPRRVETTVLRIVRNTELGKQVKRLYNYQCQVCGTRLECEGGPYAEAAHIRPLGRPHDGPDVLDNLLCLCPNHHVLFDNGALLIHDDFGLNGGSARLNVRSDHPVDRVYLQYHRSMWA
jgi:putative restriction endonuclease